jgi:hypothetical protein
MQGGSGSCRVIRLLYIFNNTGPVQESVLLVIIASRPSKNCERWPQQAAALQPGYFGAAAAPSTSRLAERYRKAAAKGGQNARRSSNICFFNLFCKQINFSAADINDQSAPRLLSAHDDGLRHSGPGHKCDTLRRQPQAIRLRQRRGPALPSSRLEPTPLLHLQMEMHGEDCIV